jgi:guanosine-3',5'-bis(diphosphate) 3'-pyrophosphohydrolase
VGVASIIADMRLDSASIITALLHDTVEDTIATLEEIEREFGSEIAQLVDGVTKIGKIQVPQQSPATNKRPLHGKRALQIAKEPC